MDFYLGADVAGLRWGVPVMVSHGRLRARKHLPRATAPWICDSRGFTELSQHGRWTIGAREYAAALRRYARDIGQLQWASPQDWMVEDFILAKTGLDEVEHQRRTVESVLLLRELLNGDVHIIPVIQGRDLAGYLRCVQLYADHGIDLTTEPVVGIGSVCRRQGTNEIGAIVAALAARGISLHGFGVKIDGLAKYGPALTSADSFAWSYGARRRGGLCPHGLVKHETNCPERAREWRDDVLANQDRAELRAARVGYQPSLFDLTA